MSQIVAYNGRIAQRALLLTTAALALVACTLAMAPSARAGKWAQRSCSVGAEYIAPEGWEGLENEGYPQMPNDNCATYLDGGGLLVTAAPASDNRPLAGQTWLYKPPRDSTIAGGVLDVQMTARSGGALVAAEVKEQFTPLASCESPGCSNFDRDVPITAIGASELYEQAFCIPQEGVCPPPENPLHEGDGIFAAEANISSAQIVLATNVIPAGSGLSGTLLNSTVTGKGTLSFTATDPGPGVYQANADIDGRRVWVGTPNLNEGKCVSTGTTEGVRAFNYAQPCPAETSVNAEIDTSGLTDGTHHLTVEVEDAAGNTAIVYDGAITTANDPAAVLGVTAPVRGPANGTPASESATLTAQWKGQSASRLKGVYGRSHEITGKLTTTAGAPIAGALIEVSQTPASLGAKVSSLAGAHTNIQGNFLINLPPSTPSTSIQLAYRSHLGDPQPAATRTLTLQVPASIHLVVSPHLTSVGHTIVLGGKLAGPIPPGGKKVLFEARVPGGSWIEFHNATVDSHGRFHATHHFTFPGPVRYQFRVVCEREADFPFLTGTSNVVRVRER
jgi:hypothetical protein